MELKRLLKSLGACEEAVRWVGDMELNEAWEKCERADWMLWLVCEMEGKKGWPDRKQLVLAACACAETALKYVPADEQGPRKAIETARAWTRGDATLDDVRKASSAAYAAAYADASAAAAASDAAYDAARAKALAEMAVIVRSILVFPVEK